MRRRLLAALPAAIAAIAADALAHTSPSGRRRAAISRPISVAITSGALSLVTPCIGISTRSRRSIASTNPAVMCRA